MGSDSDPVTENKDGGTSGKEEHTDGNGTSVRRRSVLKTVGVAIGAGAGLSGAAGFTGGARAARSASDFSFDRVLDAVDDLGMDPTGGTSISATLENNYQDGTKIVFPEGTYKITDMLYGDGSVSNFGIEGLGSSPRDVQFRPPSQSAGTRYRFAVIKGGGPHLFRNISFQQRSDDLTSVSMRVITSDGTLFEDVEWLGVTPTDENCRDELLSLSSSTQSGVTTARRVVMGKDAAGIKPGYPDGVMGIRAEKSNDGEVRLENCHIERLGSTAFRHAHCDGVVTVVGGTFKNNDLAEMRLAAGDHPSKVSSVTGATAIVKDVVDATMALQFDNSRREDAGAIVEDCDIVYDTGVGSRGVIACPSWGDHGSFTLRNCRVRNESSNYTLNVDDTSTTPDEVTIDQCHFTGNGTGDLEVAGRDGSVMKDSCFDMPNADITGTIELQNVSKSGCDEPLSGGGGGGGGEESAFAVSTAAPSSVGTGSATLNGSLDDLGGASSADVRFDYREVGASSWNATAVQTLSSTGSFGETVDNLSAGVEYEFRAVGAASDGDSDTGSIVTFDPALPNDLTVDGSNVSSQVDYEVTVSDEVQKDAKANDNDSIEGSTAVGQVNGGYDTYDFSGEVTDVWVSDDVPVYVNGEQLDLSQFDYPNDLRVDGSDLSSQVDYEVTVSDGIVKDQKANSNDTVSGTTASGQVNGGIDTYDFSGEVTDVRVSDDVPIYVDGSRLDLGQFDDYSRDLKVDGSNVSSQVDYEVTVSDGIVKDEYANDNDSVEGTTAVGQVNGGFDTYDFSGEVTDVWVSDDVPIYVDGSRLDLSQFEPSDSAPSIDRFEVTEADSPNPHANITAEYDVSDEDGDLSSGTVEVFDASGSLLDSSTTDIDDDVHYVVDYFEIKQVDGQTLTVRVTVSDQAGNEATAERTVTE